MSLQAFLSPVTTLITSDTHWYMETCSIHHITSDTTHLSQAIDYTSSATMMLSNGTIISITYLGFISLHIGSLDLHLK